MSGVGRGGEEGCRSGGAGYDLNNRAALLSARQVQMLLVTVLRLPQREPCAFGGGSHGFRSPKDHGDDGSELCSGHILTWAERGQQLERGSSWDTETWDAPGCVTGQS